MLIIIAMELFLYSIWFNKKITGFGVRRDEFEFSFQYFSSVTVYASHQNCAVLNVSTDKMGLKKY